MGYGFDFGYICGFGFGWDGVLTSVLTSVGLQFWIRLDCGFDFIWTVVSAQVAWVVVLDSVELCFLVLVVMGFWLWLDCAFGFGWIGF